MLLCEEFVFSDLKRCNEPVKRWIYSGDIPDGNPEKLKDICRKTCFVCIPDIGLSRPSLVVKKKKVLSGGGGGGN